MPGHIKLGYAGALRDYLLAKPEARNKALANPMAAKLGIGSGNYDDMQNWSGFLMEDWTAGVGKKDPSAGGSLYSQAETAYPNRLLLPYMVITPDQEFTENYTYQAGLKHPNTTISVGASSTIKKFSQKFKGQGGGGGFSTDLVVYLKNENKQLRVEFWSDTAGVPNALIDYSLITTSDMNSIGYSHYIASVATNLGVGTVYHVVIYPVSASDTITLPAFSPGIAALNNQYNGSAWSAYSTASIMISGSHGTNEYLIRLASFGGIIYGAAPEKLFGLVANDWSSVHSFGVTITDMITVGNKLYFAFNTGSNIYTTTDATVFTLGAVQANKFALWGGYLWRSLGEDVYYTGDGVTWTGPISVADPGGSILGMAGAGDFLYVATDWGLFYIGAGDQVLPVTPWASPNPVITMLSYQGALYVATDRSMIKYEAGTVLPVGIDLGEGLPALRDGKVSALAANNYGLFMAIKPTNQSGGRATVWSWNGQGWHFIASMPGNVDQNYVYNIYAMLYDRNTSRLYLASENQNLWAVTLPDVANYSSTITPIYSPFGWLETDWFVGGLYEINKDVESVYISSDICDSNRYIEVYWKDDASTDWELLGTVTSQRQELRWSSPTTRPNTKQIKLAFALYSKTVNTSPIIRAIRLKYMSMVMDRWRWTLPIEVSDNQQMPGGGINQYNAYQQKAHLETLIKSVPPFLLEDDDGAQYEVKVLSAAENITRWELIDGVQKTTKVYSLTIEQATTGTYN